MPPGTKFQDVPDDYICPICGAPKNTFTSRLKEVAGFAPNQRYGLGANSMTAATKSTIIWGGLASFFGLLMLGYFLD